MLSKALKMAVAISLIIMVSACCTPEVRYTPTPLPQPAAPLLPAIKAADTACLSNTTWADIVERDRLRKDYGEQCAAIIRANNAGVQQGIK